MGLGLGLGLVKIFQCSAAKMMSIDSRPLLAVYRARHDHLTAALNCIIQSLGVFGVLLQTGLFVEVSMLLLRCVHPTQSNGLWMVTSFT